MHPIIESFTRFGDSVKQARMLSSRYVYDYESNSPYGLVAAADGHVQFSFSRMFRKRCFQTF